MINSLDIAKRALQITQKKIDTTSHNITNMDTDGYSRQRVIQSTLSPIKDALGTYGSGPIIDRVERVRSEQLDVTYREKNTTLSYWQKSNERLSILESQVNDLDSAGLSESLNQFWTSWEDLSLDPTNTTVRNNLISDTEKLTNAFHNVNDSINKTREAINVDIQESVKDINQILSELASLNELVNANVDAKAVNNDSLDKYDSLLDDLSKYDKVTVKVKEDGSRVVYLGTDQVVSNNQYRELAAISTSSTEENAVATYKVVFKESHKELNTTDSGELGALKKLRDETLTSYQEDLDELAIGIAEAVNEVHYKGYDNQIPPQSGHIFFESDINGAEDIEISSLIKENPDLIVASLEGAEGDNRIALQISELKDKATMKGGQNFNEYTSDFFSKLGRDVIKAKNNTSLKSDEKKQVEGYRESVKGVSLDEETTNLIKFQKAYQAAAKIITVSDSILGIIIGLKT